MKSRATWLLQSVLACFVKPMTDSLCFHLKTRCNNESGRPLEQTSEKVSRFQRVGTTDCKSLVSKRVATGVLKNGSPQHGVAGRLSFHDQTTARRTHDT